MPYDIGSAYVEQQAATLFFGVPNTSIGYQTSQSPAKEWNLMIGRKWSESVYPSTLAKSKATIAAPIDPSWFREALNTLDEAASEAGGDAERRGVLEIAEELIAHFAAWPEQIRPRFSIDSLDRPSFSSKSDRHYLHATIEPELGLHWYAEIDGKEVPMPEADAHVNLPLHLTKSLAALR